MPVARVDCADADGVCPSTLIDGLACAREGLFVPCVDEQVGCDIAGCRTCEGGVWSACELPCGSGTVYYNDEDGDGHGVPGDSRVLCTVWRTYRASQAGDCDEHNASVWTAAACTQCRDDDGDGYWVGCDSYAALGGAADCDDDPQACGTACRPGGAERCDAYDNDCDGLVDTQANDCRPFYRDLDLDGHGVATDALCQCEASGDYQALFGDDSCDLNTYAWTAAHCLSCVDADGDGYFSGTVVCDRLVDSLGVPLPGGDCDDALVGCGASCYPGRSGVEICDAYDHNCDPGDNASCQLSLQGVTTGLTSAIGELTMDSSGNLWLGLGAVATTSVVHRIAAVDLVLAAPPVAAIASLKARPVNALLVDAGGDVWVGYDEGTCDTSDLVPCECGPTRITGGTAVAALDYCTDYVSTATNSVTAMLALPSGVIIMGTPDDYAVYDPIGDTIVCDYSMFTSVTGGD
ncbi:MAG: hypothetical protein AAB426_09040, partial [Myxococcota bacterium]